MSKKPAALATSLLLLLLSGAGTAAQSVWVGGRAGFGVANAIFEDDFSNGRVDPRFALQFGAMASRHLTRSLSFRVEALYSQKGWSEYNTGGGRRLTHFDVPLLLGIHAPWKVSPHLLLGPALSLEVGCAVTGVPEIGSVSCDDSQLEWQRAKVFLGGFWGIGVSAPFSKGRIHIEALMNLTLTDLNREPLPRGHISTGSVILSLGYAVPLGGN
jgi:hypothetical protein